ncbi:MAG: PDZ domain-containing protein [Planctomycetota bacterium]|jgi:hypothetical protein
MNALLTAVLTLGSLACQAATVAQDVPEGVSVTSNRHDANHSQLSLVSGDDALVLVVGEGEASAILNGKPVPQDRIKREGDRLSVLDEEGEVVFDVRVVDGFGLAYPYEGSESIIYADEDRFLRGNNQSFRVARDMFSTVTARRKLIGVTTTSVDGVLAFQLGLEPDSAFVINSVSDGKPAALAGMQVNDIVVAIENESPADTELLRERIAEREAGDELRLSVLRRGEPLELTLTLQEAAGSDDYLFTDAPTAFWSTSEGDASFPDVGYVTTLVNDAMQRQKAELAAAEAELADMRAQLEVRMTDLQDARAAGESEHSLQARVSAVQSLKEAMDRLQDVSAVLRAEALRSSREVGIASSGDSGSRSLWLPGATSRGGLVGAGSRSAPTPTAPGVADRLERMEDRLARLEEMIQRLIESGDGR